MCFGIYLFNKKKIKKLYKKFKIYSKILKNKKNFKVIIKLKKKKL